MNTTEDEEFVISQEEYFKWFMMTWDGEESWICNDKNNYEVRNADCKTPLKSDYIYVNQ